MYICTSFFEYFLFLKFHRMDVLNNGIVKRVGLRKTIVFALKAALLSLNCNMVSVKTLRAKNGLK